MPVSVSMISPALSFTGSIEAYPGRSGVIDPFRSRGGGYAAAMFLFFSNRLGCLGSILVSVVATLILLLLFGAIDLGR